MPRNGSGVYSLPQPPFTAGTVISSAAVNSDFSDIATALTASLPVNGTAGMTGQLKAADGGNTLPSLSFSNESNSGFYRVGAGQIGVTILGTMVNVFDANGLHGTVPVGALMDFAGSTAPALWLLCFGQIISRTTYASLFAAIGTTYGIGDGATTFGIPDLRGRLIAGKDNMGGSAAGNLTTTYYGTDPTVLGNSGGSQSKVLISSNLPPYTPAGSIAAIVTVSSYFDFYNIAGGTGVNPQILTNTPNRLASEPTATATGTFTGTAQGGTSAAFSAVNPSIIMNKIIYAGV